MTETKAEIVTHAVDPEAPLARPYTLTIMTPVGQLAQLAGSDAAAPRDVWRRIIAHQQKISDIIDGRIAAGIAPERAAPIWHEPALEGDATGNGYVVVADPRMIVGMSADEDELDEPDLEDEEQEEPEEEQAPTFRLPKKK